VNALDQLLEDVRYAHATHPQSADFKPFPDDPEPAALSAPHLPCAGYFYRGSAMVADPDTFTRAIRRADGQANWRRTCANTSISEDFLDRFGCDCIIGCGGTYHNAQMARYMVTLPPGLYYPWHHHMAGVLQAGAAVCHASMQSHAMETVDSSVLCYVVWRNHLCLSPVLTESTGALGMSLHTTLYALRTALRAYACDQAPDIKVFCGRLMDAAVARIPLPPGHHRGVDSLPAQAAPATRPLLATAFWRRYRLEAKSGIGASA